MIAGLRAIAIIPVYGESAAIGTVLGRFEPGYVDEICVVADKPGVVTLGAIEEASRQIRIPIKTIQNPARNGIGYAIRQGYKYALENGFALIVIMAGNRKDDPPEIPRLTTPILEEGYEYFHGSRFLVGRRP